MSDGGSHRATEAARVAQEEGAVAESLGNVGGKSLATLARSRRARIIIYLVALVAAALAVVAVALWPRGRPPEPRAQQSTPVSEGKAPGPAPKRPPVSAPKPPPPKQELRREQRMRMLSEVWQAQGEAQRRFRQKPDEESLAALQQAADKARALIAAARGTEEARHARYSLFRCLEMAGEREQAEAEFEAYIEAIAAAKGRGAACKALDEEGRRERQTKNYDIALKRFRTVLAYEREGETAAMAHVGIASCYAATRQRGPTERAFRQALELGLPTREASRAYRYLINVAISHRDYGHAARDTAALLALPTPPAQKAADEARLGFVVESTEGPIKAIEYYRKLLKKYPDVECRLAKSRLKALLAKLDADILGPLPDESGGPQR